jgi:hypothetical protein
MTEKELVAFALELIEHLDYCGWGDKWERECSEELRTRAEKFQQEHAP